MTFWTCNASKKDSSVTFQNPRYTIPHVNLVTEAINGNVKFQLIILLHTAVCVCREVNMLLQCAVMLDG